MGSEEQTEMFAMLVPGETVAGRKGDPTMERRRRVPRQTAGWTGKYCIEGDETEAWYECRVLDISVIGVGVELFGSIPQPASSLLGRRVVVEAHTPAGASLSIRARGEVRNVSPGAEGGTRAGMEFIELTDNERSILDALVLMDALW
jgi:PilZ domain